MGCRLPKLKKAEERTSPGNIYSTLRRPQVETKIGVAYTYHFLDFLLEVPVSSVLCLSSVRELPVQVRELYSQGFVLVAVHPFVHACGPGHAHIQRQLHRAVLIRETHRYVLLTSSFPNNIQTGITRVLDISPFTGTIRSCVMIKSFTNHLKTCV
uniref:Uncharacterized protein n=1 Tax=Neogobius melanostomus TaxID=47308 RepID=A0A8C6T5A3_9GOBI